MILVHYPEGSKWQLLKEPLTLEDFNNSQFVKPIWFMIGFDIKAILDNTSVHDSYTGTVNNNIWRRGKIDAWLGYVSNRTIIEY